MRRRVAVLLWAAAVAVAFSPGAGAAAAPEATGWWWRTQTGLLGAVVPPPPGVDADDLLVAGAPDGATAVAALRWRLAAGEGQPSLTLVAKSEAGGDNARVAACQAGAAWLPAQGGRWDDKPPAACDLGSVQGIRVAGTDGTASWVFALEPLLRPDGTLDVVLVAGTLDGQPQGAANGSTFQLVFEQPGAGALVTTMGATPGGAPVPEPSPAPSPAAEAAAQPFTPALPAGPVAPGPAGAPEAAPPPPAERAPAPARRPLDPIADDDAAGGRGAAVVILVVAAAAASVLAWPRLGEAIGLGRLGLVAAPVVSEGPEVRGLGRFARPRAGPPPPL